MNAAAVVSLGAFSVPANAHEVYHATVTVPPVSSGASTEIALTCPGHLYAIAGGFANNDQLNPASPLIVTANYPKSTRTWAIELTNGSGRPTSVDEARVTLYITCDHHHW